MTYKVRITPDAEEDLDGFLACLINERNSKQAAINVLNDFEATVQTLTTVAGSLKMCDNLKLKELGYRRINFLSHRYFMLYRIEKNKVYVDAILHGLQDLERKMM